MKKKVMSLVMAGMMVLSLAGCNSKPAETTAATAASSEAESEAASAEETSAEEASEAGTEAVSRCYLYRWF